MSVTLRYKDVKTRKPHECFGCRRLFPRDTIMQFSAFVDAGIVHNCYLCQTCLNVLYERNDIDEFCRGDLREMALEMEQERT